MGEIEERPQRRERRGPAAPGGLVLAGGAGRRLGRPKATVRLRGRTLVEHAVGLLQPLCSEIVVATRRGVPLPELDVTVVEDPDGPQAAVAGLATGLGALHTADVVVLACDVLASPALIDRLLGAPGEAAVAVTPDGSQPLCARYPRLRALAVCQEMLRTGDLRARQLVDLLGADLVRARPGEVINVNTWPDLFAASLAGVGVRQGERS